MPDSLRTRITLLFLLVTVVLVAIMVAFTLSAVGEHYTNLFLQRGQVAALELSSRAERLFRLGLLLDEFLGFEKQCREVVETNTGIRRALLVDRNGKVLYQGGETPNPAKTTPDTPRFTVDGTLQREGLWIRQPLTGVALSQEGAVLIEVDRDAVDEEVYRLLTEILRFSSLVTLIGILIVILFLRLYLWDPTAKLLNHIREVRPENLETLPPELPLRKDEIGTIAHAFDALIVKLASTQRALLNANQTLAEHAATLEREVRERTRKLTHANRELARLARTDPLTGLPNRLHFMEFFGQRFEHAKRHRHTFAVFLLDLDNFKEINDRWGHEAGDHTLMVIAHRVRHSFRSDDVFFRLGGDEFVLVVEDFGSNTDLERLALKLKSLITEPFQWQEQPLSTSASIGIALPEWERDQDPDSLLKAADKAMYQAKRSDADFVFAQTA